VQRYNLFPKRQGKTQIFFKKNKKMRENREKGGRDNLAAVPQGTRKRRAARNEEEAVPQGTGRAVPQGTGRAVPQGTGRAVPQGLSRFAFGKRLIVN